LVSAYLSHLQQRGYADRTLFAEGTVIKQVIRSLVNEGYIPQDCLLKLPLRKIHGTDTYCWSEDEVFAMIKHCREHARLNWLADVILALAHTGLRIGELVGLRWSDIDYEENLIRVVNDSPGAAARPSGRRRTKNRRDRTIPIHSTLRTALLAMDRRSDGRVFHGPLGGKLKADTVRTILIRDVIEQLKAKFPSAPGERGFEHGRVHSFRHYFCSVAVNAGVPVTVLMEWLGHRNSTMVRHYYHLHNGESQKQMSQLDFAGAADSNGAVERTPEDLEAPPSGRAVREAS
jgi:integrase